MGRKNNKWKIEKWAITLTHIYTLELTHTNPIQVTQRIKATIKQKNEKESAFPVLLLCIHT